MRQYWKGSALLAPVPSVLVTSGTLSRANVLTVGWCGVVSTRPPRVSIALRPERHSHAIISESREFALNLTPASLVEVVDWCGTVTGRCVDKIAKTGLELLPSREVAAPTLADSPLSLECRVTDILPQGSHDLFLADVVGVSVDDALLDEKGKLRLERAGLLVYAHGSYYALGRRLGPIGLSMQNNKKGKLARVSRTAPPRKSTGGKK